MEKKTAAPPVRSKWKDAVAPAPKRLGVAPDHYKMRDLTDDLVIPEMQEDWIKSIGGIMSNTTDYRDIKRKLRERAECYVHRYEKGACVADVEKHAQAIFLHLAAKRDNERVLQDMMHELRAAMDASAFVDRRRYLVNSILNCYTPLDDAAFNGAFNCFQLLLIWGAEIDRQNHDQESLEDTIRSGADNMRRRNPTLYATKKRSFEQCIAYLERWRSKATDRSAPPAVD